MSLASRIAADAILVAHVLFVAFVVLGLVLTLVGGGLGWGWVRDPRFRVAHLMALAIVVVQAWLGRICFLTTWEMALRERAGEATYAGSFVAHWLGELLYVEAAPGVFTAAYTLFGILVLASWWWVKPTRGSSS